MDETASQDRQSEASRATREAGAATQASDAGPAPGARGGEFWRRGPRWLGRQRRDSGRPLRAGRFPDAVPSRGPLRVGLAGLAALAGLAGLPGCNAEGDYLIWPESVRTGETVAILFNTEADNQIWPEGALLDAGVHNVVVRVSDATGWTEVISPRLVLESPAALGSQAVVGETFGSLTGLVAVFDLPDPWPNGAVAFPAIFDVLVEYQGMPTAGSNQLMVLGGGGLPIAFSASPGPLALELQPAVRLRPAWDPTAAVGFDPSWTIGGLEFTLRYRPGAGEVQDLQALANGEATGGLATATPLQPQGSDRLWRVVLMHPFGFALPEFGCDLGGRCFAGRWSLLDLPLFADDAGLPDGSAVFTPGDFTIEDLRVVDPLGQTLGVGIGSTGETFFHVYTASNIAPLSQEPLPVPSPAFGTGLVAGLTGLAGLAGLSRRRDRAREPGSIRGGLA